MSYGKQIPHGPAHLDCPAWKQPMSEVCHKCPKWMQLRGLDRNSGHEIDRWDCADTWTTHLLIALTQKTDSVGAATESFRNEMVAIAVNGAPRRDQSPMHQRIASNEQAQLSFDEERH